MITSCRAMLQASTCASIMSLLDMDLIWFEVYNYENVPVVEEQKKVISVNQNTEVLVPATRIYR